MEIDYNYIKEVKDNYRNRGLVGNHINLGFGDFIVYDEISCKYYLIDVVAKTVTKGISGIELLMMFRKNK